MAGQRNRRGLNGASFAPSDQHVEDVRELADSLGYPMREVFERFCLLVLLRQSVGRMPPVIAEWLALRDVQEMHDRRGQQPS